MTLKKTLLRCAAPKGLQLLIAGYKDSGCAAPPPFDAQALFFKWKCVLLSGNTRVHFFKSLIVINLGALRVDKHKRRTGFGVKK
jgi:hypothetical protein